MKAFERLEREDKLYNKFNSQAENLEREFLIKKLVENKPTSFSYENLKKLHKNTINTFWSNMMKDLVINAIDRF